MAAKAPKAPKAAKPVSQLSLDTQTIAKDFARTATYNIDETANAAILRHITDEAAFNGIRIEALAHWAVARATHYVATETKALAAAQLQWSPRELDLKLARSIFDGSTRGHTTKIGKKPVRDAFMQHLYGLGGQDWFKYLVAHDVDTLNKSKQGARGPRVKTDGEGEGEGEGEGVEAPAQANPVTIEAIQVERSTSFEGVLTQANKSSAHLSRVCTENAKIIKGDAGSRLRALATHVAAELKAIAALKA